MAGTNTLGPGSPGAQLPTQVADYSYAGMATRVMTNSPPADSDWGATPPPDGTMVITTDQFLWVRTGGAWYYVELHPATR
jgi:hypothetical protein